MKRLGGGLRSGGEIWGLQWGCFKGLWKGGGSSLLMFLGQQKGRGALPELANTFSQ